MRRLGEPVMQDDAMRLYQMELGPFSTNAYLVVCHKTGEGVLVDAPGDAPLLAERLEGIALRCILITHGHADHTGALEEIKQMNPGAALAAHAADSGALPVKPDLLLKDGDTVECGKLKLAVLHTPGHTPGSLCFKAGGCLLAGDTIFPGGPGKTWTPAEFKEIVKSITTKIFPLPADTRIFPGHGNDTTVGAEKKKYAVFASRPADPDLCGDVTWLG